MANVKDLLVNGSARVIGTIYGNATSANKVNHSLTFGSKSFNGSSAQTITLADLGGKPTQSAVSSPSASGTEISFIDTISQNANGVITATKKTVRDASNSQSGIVSTGAQTFAGNKTFYGNVTIGSMNGDTVVGAGNFKIGVRNDSYGIMPYTNNWNSIGASGLYWYRAYVTNYYGTNAYITNYSSNGNIGSAASSSNASTLGYFNFYNNAAAGSTQTKTKITAHSEASENLTITLPKTNGILLNEGNYNDFAIAKISSSTDNAIVRWDGTDGKKVQDSLITINDSGDISGAGNIYPLDNNNKNLGSSSLKWANIYATTFHGSLDGNANTSSVANKLTDINSTDLASSTDTWRRIWFSYNDNTTGRPAYSDNFVYQSSTNTLKVANIQGNASSATKATQDGNGKVITTEYVHKTNSSSTLNQFSGAPKYLLGIEAFADGGEVKWQDVSDIKVGSADTATKLATARTINGTDFDGSAAITTANWGTARTLTIGNTGKSVNGSGNVSWSLSEIGAAASSHNHTSLTGVTSIAFSAESSDSASIKTTIEGSSTSFDFMLSDDLGQNDQWRWRFTPSGGTVYDAMRLKPTAQDKADLYVGGTKVSLEGHTHNYAGSASSGGSANSAVKLDTTTAGDNNTPVYFAGGKPVACTSLDLNTSGNAASATKLKNFGLTKDTVDNVTHTGLIYSTIGSYTGPGFASSDAMILSMSWDNSNNYGAQIALDDTTTPNMYVRNKSTSWSAWSKVLLSTNYTDYTVKKDGTGASGNWGINISGNASGLKYHPTLSTDDDINNFNTANTFKAALWNGTSSPGVSNGVILSGAWDSNSYGFQIAIDDDPGWYIALRQRTTDGWRAWKRIPMGDGTGASGTWNISVNGSSTSCTGNAATATKLATARTISLTGSITGSGTFDGSGNLNINTTKDTGILSRGDIIDTHIEGYQTIILDSGNDLGAFYERGGTCNAYEVDISTTNFTGSLTSRGTLSSIPASVFNGLSGYTGGSYGGDHFAVYDLALPNGLSYSKIFWWSFGTGSWKPSKIRILASHNGVDWTLNYTSDSCPAYGKCGLGVPSGVTCNYIRIVVNKYDRLSCFGARGYSSTGLNMTYMNRCQDDWIYRSITPAKNDYYNLGSDSNRWNNIYGAKVYGAVWNDYAEYRQSDVTEPGRCVYELGDDTLALTTKRLQKGCEIISDTFGFAIGETEERKTPIACSGRVLAYPYESREEFKKHIGDCVCSGPSGTVSIMTPEEEEKYPGRIIGTISAVPEYEHWGSGNVLVDGRVWIRIR